MHKNVLWQAFLLVFLLITLWYSGVALYKYYIYSRLTGLTEAVSTEWVAIRKAEDEYLIEGKYTFLAGNKTEKGSTLFRDVYRNRWTAEQYIPNYSRQKWKVWYIPGHPQYSTLQKSFPFKESISAIFLIGLLLYFLWLGFYVTRFKI